MELYSNADLVHSVKSGLSSSTDISIGQKVTSKFDSTSLPIDTLITLQSNSKTFAKGRIKKQSRSLGSESLGSPSIAPGESFIEGAPWTAVHEAYNVLDECLDKVLDCTIQQFVDFEYAGLVATWFDGVTVPASLQNLVCGASTTYQKSWWSVLNDIIAPYPFIRWCIDYSTPGAIYPLGTLVLVDTRVGRASFALQVGGVSPVVIDGEIEYDASDTATNLNIRGKGLFTELEETLVPSWPSRDENIAFGPVALVMPTDGIDRNGTISSGPLVAYQSGVSYWNPQHDINGVPTIVVDGVTCFTPADFTCDFNAHMIIWGAFQFAAEEDLWVHKTTGAVVTSLIADTPPSSDYRRPIWYHNTHFGKSATIAYHYMAWHCYRVYHVSKKIAPFKLWPVQQANPFYPAHSINQFYTAPLQVEPVVEAFQPRLGPGRFLLDFTSAVVPFPDAMESGAYHLADIYIPTIDQIIKPVNNVGFVDATVDAYIYPMGAPEFREGTDCVIFQDRQCAMLAVGFQDFLHPITPKLLTWSIKVIYVAWENFGVTRTGSNGPENYVNIVVDSIYKYINILGTTTFDLTARLNDVADAVLDYYGTPVWTGSIEVKITKDGMSGEWDVPYKLGDKITFTGVTLTPAFAGIINAIDYSELEKGKVTLGFGRVEPRKNPFVPRPLPYVDVEAPSNLSDVFGGQRV